jgi:probable addiction module antidote protein
MRKRKTYRDFHELVRDTIRHPNDAAEYLSDAAEEGDSAVFLLALKDVLDVHGSLSALSRKTGLNRANLHQMLHGKTSPRLDTLTKVLGSAGLGISIVALKPKKRSATRARVPGADRTVSRASRPRSA